jgi:hypothetical protein
MITSDRLKIFSVRIWRKERLARAFAFAIASGEELITRSGISLRVIIPFSTDVSIKKIVTKVETRQK